jgi:hypothetical protein
MNVTSWRGKQGIHECQSTASSCLAISIAACTHHREKVDDHGPLMLCIARPSGSKTEAARKEEPAQHQGKQPERIHKDDKVDRIPIHCLWLDLRIDFSLKIEYTCIG